MPSIKITVTVPKEIINIEKVKQAIIDAQEHRTKPALLKLFGLTVNGWRNRPDFRSRRIDTSSQLGIRVEPSGSEDRVNQYALVNEGARRHVIRPKQARMLRFRSGYKAGTRPRVLHSDFFERTGGFVTARMVQHPGFVAREFTLAIAQEHESDFVSDMQQAIADATK